MNREFNSNKNMHRDMVDDHIEFNLNASESNEPNIEFTELIEEPEQSEDFNRTGKFIFSISEIMNLVLKML